MLSVKSRLREALRPATDRDLWLDPAPTREEIERRLEGDDDARALLDDWSMLECVQRFIRDERLQMAYLGQGVIGTNASPADRGHGIGVVSPRLRAHVRHARHLGLRARRHGDDLVHPLRHRARGRRRGRDGSERRANSAGRGRGARIRRARHRPRRHLERRPARDAPIARRRRRCGVARRGGGSAGRRRDREAEHDAARATELPCASRNERAAPHRAGQHAAHRGRVGDWTSRGECGRAAGANLDRAIPSHGLRSIGRAGGRAHPERVRAVRAAHLRARRAGSRAATKSASA